MLDRENSAPTTAAKEVRCRQGVTMQLSNGAALANDLHFREGHGPSPALGMRLPNGRVIASIVVYTLVSFLGPAFLHTHQKINSLSFPLLSL